MTGSQNDSLPRSSNRQSVPTDAPAAGDKNNVFNVGFNGENYQKIRIAEIVKKFVPETKIEIVKTGADLRNYQVDFSKLQEFLNIKNEFMVEDGVKGILGLLEDRIIRDPYESRYYNTSPALEA